MKTLIKSCLSIALIVPISFSLLTGQAKAITTPQNLQKGDLIINEISWAGSSYSASDEWIELYNPTANQISLESVSLIGAGGKPEGIPLIGTIDPGGFYVISNFADTDDRSSLAISPDLLSPSLAITNSAFSIKLIVALPAEQILLDEAITLDTPTAGINTTTMKATMARIMPTTDGAQPLSWQSSRERKNIKPNKVINNKCVQNFGTPKFKNQSATLPAQIEFENSCIGKGEIIENNGQTSLKLTGPLSNYTVLNQVYNFDNQLVSVNLDIVGSVHKDAINNFSVQLNNTVFSEQRTANLQFIKTAELSSGIIKLDITLADQEVIILDSIAITTDTKISPPLTIQSLKLAEHITPTATSQPTILGTTEFNKDQNTPGKLLGFSNKQYCASSTFCTLEVDINVLQNTPGTTKIADLYLWEQGSGQAINSAVFHMNEMSHKGSISMTITKSPYTQVSFSLVSYNNASLEISDISLRTDQRVLAEPTQLSSIHAGLTTAHTYRTGIDDGGYNGKLLDVMTSEQLTEGTYFVHFDIRKLENYSAKKSIFRIAAYDSRGTKLFDESISENTLVQNVSTNKVIEFKLAKPSKIYLYPVFIGNQKGAFSDLSVGNFSITR